jgi:hypothetical protein
VRRGAAAITFVCGPGDVDRDGHRILGSDAPDGLLGRCVVADAVCETAHGEGQMPGLEPG